MAEFKLTEAERRAVVEAYKKAHRDRRPPTDCYKAGIDALYRLHPGAIRAIVSKEAVKVLTSDAMLAERAVRRRGAGDLIAG